ncbi:unnamed protein product [Ectocarpus sp. 12 AP-2014]
MRRSELMCVLMVCALACPSSSFLLNCIRTANTAPAVTAVFLGRGRRLRPTAVQRVRCLRTQTRASAGINQDSTPLVDALAKAAGNVRSPLFFPGHKMGSGAPSRLVDLILGGKLDALRHDLPELPELDNLFAPEGPIRDAELLAADAFGAAKTWMLANGSTCGVLASIIACVQWHNSRPGRPPLADAPAGSGGGRKSVVVLPRDAHKSAVHALVLSGATPCFLPPLRHPESGVGLGVGTAELKAALKEHGDEVAAVFMVSPTYEGACSDVTSAAEACHGAGVPLVVDEAHGAHLAFLGEAQPPPSRPSEEEEEGGEGEEGGRDKQGSSGSSYPRAALRCGADLVVQSAHKTLGSLTQSAFLHLGQGKLVVVVAVIGSLLFHPLELRPPANSKVDAVHMQSDRLVEKVPPC